MAQLSMLLHQPHLIQTRLPCLTKLQYVGNRCLRQRHWTRNSRDVEIKHHHRLICSVIVQPQQCTYDPRTLTHSCSGTSSSRELGIRHINALELKQFHSSGLRWFHTSGSQQFHTSGRRDAIPPLIWIVVSFLSKTTAVFTGRKYRIWLKSQPSETQERHQRRTLQFWCGLAMFGSTLLALYYYSHLQEAPMTGRKRFITLTRDQYLKVADYETENFLELYGEKIVLTSDPSYQYVLTDALRIVNKNQDFPGMKEQHWTIHVVKDNERNAFVLPNGHIFVFTGMLAFVENHDQFAFILGHEMSHALLLHGAEQLSYGQFLDYIVIGVMAAIWTLMPSDGIAIVTNWFYHKVMDLTVHKPYSRVLEKEADKVGLHLIAKACYDVREGSVLWYRMGIADDIKGEANLPEWLSTHPTHNNRVKFVDQLIPKAIQERTSCKCDRLSDLDPRKRAIEIRKEVDNVMIARASKANIERTHTDKQKPAIQKFPYPSIQPLPVPKS